MRDQNSPLSIYFLFRMICAANLKGDKLKHRVQRLAIEINEKNVRRSFFTIIIFRSLRVPRDLKPLSLRLIYIRQHLHQEKRHALAEHTLFIVCSNAITEMGKRIGKSALGSFGCEIFLQI